MRIIIGVVVAATVFVVRAIAADSLPANDINCNDFTKQGPEAWFANGEVHLKIDGISITYNNSTVKPGAKTTTGVDIYALLDSLCGGH